MGIQQMAFGESSVQLLTVYPAFWLDSREPFLSCWDLCQIFLGVKFPEVPDRKYIPFAVCSRDTENLFAQEDAFRVVLKGAVTEVREERLRLVNPILNSQAVVGLPPILLALLCITSESAARL